ncbi:MAG TPA: DUF58 domain-containing protein [Chloroflexota bacterium]|nr:DUF58 domain-containing protein [Chloroflexota bacterium]
MIAQRASDTGKARPSTLLGLDPSFIGRLDRLSLVARQRVRGQGAGPRRSLATGSSVEFADFRTYAPGDDFRRVDWNAYARLERLFLRIFEAEENSTVTIFVDCSTSMAGGDPSKARLARQIAAALSYLALTSYDRVAVCGLGERLGPYLPPRSGRDRAPEVWRFIAELPSEGATALQTLRAYEGYTRGPGLAMVISDLLTESDWRGGMRALKGACRQEITLLQVLSPQELQPDLEGDLTLVDAETQGRVELSVTPAVLRRYQEALAAYTAEIGEWCRGQGLAFAQLSSATPVEDVALRLLRRMGVAQ